MQKLIITKSAYEIIKKESLKYKTETGGLLIGTLRKPVVFKASQAGIQAKLSSMSYSNDTDYDNQILQQAINESNGKCKLIGYWHKHPRSLTHPSDGDFDQTQQIVAKNESEGDNRPVYFIITNVNKEVQFYAYSFAPSQQDFERLMIEITNDSAHEVKQALNEEPVIIQPREMDFWKGNFNFYLTPFGYKRLKQEVDILIKLGYKVNVYAGEQLCIKLEKAETVLCYPPPEYPLNPPRFFKDNEEIRYFMPIWNSTYKISDILNNLNHFQKTKRRLYEGDNAKTNIRRTMFIEKIRSTVKFVWNRKRKRRTDMCL